MQQYVTLFDKCAYNGNDVRMGYNNRTTLCNSVQPCEMMLQQSVMMCIDVTSMFRCSYNVTYMLQS